MNNTYTLILMKKILGIVLLISVALSAQAQLLWKVSGNGLVQPSYIMGTHHLSPLSIKDSIAGMKQALADTKQVYGEVTMSDMQNPAVAAEMMKKFMMTDSDTTLQSLFTPQEYEMIHKYSKENLMLDLAMMPKLKPAFLSNNLLVVLYIKHIGGFNPQEQLDSYFQAQATASGKKVGGLETMEYQFNLLFNGTSLKRQAEQLLCMLNNIDKNIEDLKRVTAYYNAQNLDAMTRLMNERQGDQCDPLPGEMEAMLDNRNKNWVAKLPAILKADPTLVVVGAGHLLGECGLLNLLRKQGYTVEPTK